MYRGTTPILTFNVKTELDLNEIDLCLVTLQSKVGLKEKTFNEVSIDDENKKISVALTQEDTLFFNKGDIYVQLKVKLKNDMVYASSIIKTTMEDILNEEIV